jgi:hypothetical protein
MGTIVSFVPRPAAKTRRIKDHSVAASVIIFPGVRYERFSYQRDSSSVVDPRNGPRNPGPVRH